MQHGTASSERVRDDPAGSDLGFLPLNLQGWVGLDWGAGQPAAPEQRRGPACALSGASPSWEKLMVVVGKPASIQHFICLYKSRNVSFHPPGAAAAAAFPQAAPSGCQAPFFLLFLFILLQTVKPLC